MQLKLTMIVDYAPNGVSVTDLKHNLEYVAKHAAAEGMLTGDSDAKVEVWSATVDEVK